MTTKTTLSDLLESTTGAMPYQHAVDVYAEIRAAGIAGECLLAYPEPVRAAIMRAADKPRSHDYIEGYCDIQKAVKESGLYQ